MSFKIGKVVYLTPNDFNKEILLDDIPELKIEDFIKVNDKNDDQ